MHRYHQKYPVFTLSLERHTLILNLGAVLILKSSFNSKHLNLQLCNELLAGYIKNLGIFGLKTEMVCTIGL